MHAVILNPKTQQIITPITKYDIAVTFSIKKTKKVLEYEQNKMIDHNDLLSAKRNCVVARMKDQTGVFYPAVKAYCISAVDEYWVILDSSKDLLKRITTKEKKYKSVVSVSLDEFKYKPNYFLLGLVKNINEKLPDIDKYIKMHSMTGDIEDIFIQTAPDSPQKKKAQENKTAWDE